MAHQRSLRLLIMILMVPISQAFRSQSPLLLRHDLFPPLGGINTSGIDSILDVKDPPFPPSSSPRLFGYGGRRRWGLPLKYLLLRQRSYLRIPPQKLRGQARCLRDPEQRKSLLRLSPPRRGEGQYPVRPEEGPQCESCERFQSGPRRADWILSFTSPRRRRPE